METCSSRPPDEEINSLVAKSEDRRAVWKLHVPVAVGDVAVSGVAKSEDRRAVWKQRDDADDAPILPPELQRVRTAERFGNK